MAASDPFAQIPAPANTTVPPPAFTAVELLQQAIDPYTTKDGEPSVSSAKNIFFASIGKITYGPQDPMFGQNRGGYPNDLSKEKRYQPIMPLEIGVLDDENKAVHAMRHYVLDPVSKVLEKETAPNSIAYRIEHTVHGVVKRDPEPAKVNKNKPLVDQGVDDSYYGDVDAAWLKTNKEICFAEFKRPGSLSKDHWKGPGAGTSWAVKISRQGIKYLYAKNVRYIVYGDGKTFLFLLYEHVSDAFVVWHRTHKTPPANTPGLDPAKPAIWPAVSALACWETRKEYWKPRVFAFVMQSAASP